MPSIFSDAVKKSAKEWDQSYTAPDAGAASYESYQAFLAAGPQNNETQYYKSDGANGFVQLAKVNNLSLIHI